MIWLKNCSLGVKHQSLTDMLYYLLNSKQKKIGMVTLIWILQKQCDQIKLYVTVTFWNNIVIVTITFLINKTQLTIGSCSVAYITCLNHKEFTDEDSFNVS